MQTDPDSDPLDPALEQALDGWLCPPAPEDGELLARVKTRVMAAVRSEGPPGSVTVRHGDGQWERVAPGVERKCLWQAGEVFSWMVRLQPGARFAAHQHVMPEECVVLAGRLRIGALSLQAGDFHLVPEGTAHEVTATDTGAMIYLRGAEPRLLR